MMQVKTKKLKKGISKLPPLLERKYKRRKTTVAEIGRLTRLIDELKMKKKAIDDILMPHFFKNGSRCKLANGIIVELEMKDIEERIAKKKGELIQSGYSYPHYKELAGE